LERILPTVTCGGRSSTYTPTLGMHTVAVFTSGTANGDGPFPSEGFEWYFPGRLWLARQPPATVHFHRLTAVDGSLKILVWEQVFMV
jgi:hypothetical protein